MSVAIQLEHVTKRFGSGHAAVTALRDVSLRVQEGALVVVAGPSGSGKTALLHLVGGIETPTAGRIEAAGLDLTQRAERALSRFRRQRVGFIFQQFNLLGDLTVRENIELPLILNGSADRAARVAGLLERLGLSGRAGAFPRDLSAGEQQRVAIARGVAHRPKLLLADEPTANLDTANAREVIALLSEINREERVTILLTTHDPAVIDRIPSRIFLRDGAIARVEGVGASACHSGEFPAPPSPRCGR